MANTPIALFTYARLAHTQQTVESLLRNQGVEQHDLIVFSDAARHADKAQAVADVRKYLASITGFRSVTIHHRPQNLGLAQSIITGVTQVLNDYEQLIVLEDDMVTSPHFLSYMNAALARFKDDENVISIHGYVYPVEGELPEAFFLRGADCWGWATWRRGWAFFNPDGNDLLQQLEKQGLQKAFNFNGSYDYLGMLKAQIDGKNDSWAIRWYASAFLANKLTLYPGRSLVHNIGNDNSGTHCGENKTYDTNLSTTPINFTATPVQHSSYAANLFEVFFRTHHSVAHKIKNKLREYYRQQAFYPKILGIFINPFFLARKNLASAICDFSPQINGNIVDIGCGTKPYRSSFNVKSYRGLDIDTTHTRNLGIADDFYDGKILPYAKESFDAAICNQVLEHVFNPESFLSEINRVIKSDGKLLLTVPFVWDEHEQPFDYARYTSFGLFSLLEKSGFHVIEHRKLGANAGTIFQLLNAYLYKITQHWPKAAKICLTLTGMAGVNLIGLIAEKTLPKNPDLFLDHIILATKISCSPTQENEP